MLDETIFRGARLCVVGSICRDPQVHTGSSVALSFTNGGRHFISSQPNNRALAFADLDLAMLKGADHLLRADLWFSEPMLEGGNARLLQAARDRGLATSLDLNWDPLWGSGDTPRIAARKAAVRSLLPLASLVHGNVRELTLFADAADLPTALRRLTSWGAEAVVIHLGGEGAGYFTGGNLIVEPCAPVSRVVHTAGAGDLVSVCLMLLHARREVPMADQLRLANRIVAEFIEGKREVLPRLGDFIRRQEAGGVIPRRCCAGTRSGAEF